jgi:hypothetical protein
MRKSPECRLADRWRIIEANPHCDEDGIVVIVGTFGAGANLRTAPQASSSAAC